MTSTHQVMRVTDEERMDGKEEGKKGVELTFAISIHLPRPSCHEKTSILGYSTISIPVKREKKTGDSMRTKPEDLSSWNGTNLGVRIESWLELQFRVSSLCKELLHER